MKNNIQVLMSTYNGERYLCEQIESILNQKFEGRDWCVTLLVRDDGSDDNTVSILEDYSKQGKLTYISGEHKGSERSFWELICKADNADWYALSDQDDVWFEDKLQCALEHMDTEDFEIPLLYCSEVMDTDDVLDIKMRKKAPLPFLDFPHALIYSKAAGCTFVFNEPAKDLLRMYDMDRYGVFMHDWHIDKIVSLFGKVIFDPKSHMFYRQHRHNVIGRKGFDFMSTVDRIFRFLHGEAKVRSEAAVAIAKAYGRLLPGNCRNRKYLIEVAQYRKSWKKTKVFLFDPDFRTGTKQDIFLFFLILLRML